MPDIISVLASYEKTISANEQEGVTSRMFLNNIAKQNHPPSRMILQNSRAISVAHRRRTRQTVSEGCGAVGSSSQPYPTLSSRIQTVPKFKTPTDVTITTCSMDDDDSDEGAWNASNNDPFGDEASCNVDDDGFQLFSRTTEDSWHGSFNSFNGTSLASNPRQDLHRSTTTPNERQTSTRSTRTRDRNHNEDDGFAVIFQSHEEENSFTSNSCNESLASTANSFNAACSKQPVKGPASHRPPNESKLPKANSYHAANDAMKSSSSRTFRRASVAGAVAAVTPAPDGTEANLISRGSRNSGRRASLGVEVVSEAPASTISRRSPARTKSSDGAGGIRRRSRSRPRQPSSADPTPSPSRTSTTHLTPDSSQRTRTTSLNEVSARSSSDASRRTRTTGNTDVNVNSSSGSPRHPSLSAPNSDASHRTRTTSLTEATGTSTSPRHPTASTSSARRPGTTITTPGTSHQSRKGRGNATGSATAASRHSGTGMSDIERLCSRSSQLKKSTTLTPSSKAVAGGTSRPRTRVASSSSQDKKSEDETFRKMLDHSQNFDWDD